MYSSPLLPSLVRGIQRGGEDDSALPLQLLQQGQQGLWLLRASTQHLKLLQAARYVVAVVLRAGSDVARAVQRQACQLGWVPCQRG